MFATRTLRSLLPAPCSLLTAYRLHPAYLAALLLPLLLAGTYPSWWLERGVLRPGAVTNDYAAVNQG